MLIQRPDIAEQGDELCVSAGIQIGDRETLAPEQLWFRVHKSYREHLSDRSDAFVVAMLPVAMTLGEALEVRGRTSRRLAYGLREYQRVLTSWWPQHFRIVDVEYEQLESTRADGRRAAVGCSFSGGVDSFYSLWSHLPQNESIPEFRITHCLTVNGFDRDVDLDDTGFFRCLRQVYEPLIHSLGLEPLTVCTNLKQFRVAAIAPSILHLCFGAALTAPVLLLGRLFSRFYIPGSCSYSDLVPEGAHPMLDHLLSTESLEMLHDGAEASRVEKTAAIAHWPETYSRLRVCWDGKSRNINEETGAVENCCSCGKCVRTMVALDLLAALPRYSSFPHPLTRRNVRKCVGATKASRVFARENLDLALRQGRKGVALDLRYAIFRSRLVQWIGRARLGELLRVLRLERLAGR